MSEILIVAGLLVFLGLPSLIVLCACIAGTRADADYEAHSITQKKLLNAHPNQMSRQVPSTVLHDKLA
jgi:hypothetical protein